MPTRCRCSWLDGQRTRKSQHTAKYATKIIGSPGLRGHCSRLVDSCINVWGVAIFLKSRQIMSAPAAPIRDSLPLYLRETGEGQNAKVAYRPYLAPQGDGIKRGTGSRDSALLALLSFAGEKCVQQA